MTRIVKRNIIVGIILSFLLLLGSGLVVYSTADPDTRLGFGVFRVLYAMPIPKDWFLQAFSEGLRKNNGGYIGQPVDEFLCSRLETTDSDAERIAIAEFYISQASGREGQGIAEISNDAKQKVIPLVLSRLDNYEPFQAEKALLIVDWLRRGKVLCKAQMLRNPVYGLYDSRESTVKYDWKEWWLQSGLPEAKFKYRDWWNTNLNWQQKNQIDPLAQSNMYIQEGCG